MYNERIKADNVLQVIKAVTTLKNLGYQVKLNFRLNINQGSNIHFYKKFENYCLTVANVRKVLRSNNIEYSF